MEEIIGFEVAAKYFPTLDSTESDVKDGFGSLQNQYPINKNLSFFPSMVQGMSEAGTGQDKGQTKARDVWVVKECLLKMIRLLW